MNYSENFPRMNRAHMFDRIPAHVKLVLSKRAYEFRHSFRDEFLLFRILMVFIRSNEWTRMEKEKEMQRTEQEDFNFFFMRTLWTCSNMFKHVFA